ncbi:aldehyde dehydrogenase [Enemella evansiae]|uniref:bifunctional proline dehydrogenase/L-glutamate gamma-semialdehyde dehydrogenase n=1 Tax=Enemella evansiae TaxID=2016499 RepID=UPI000B95DF6E|nr:bifunctional proline dehydrogenase/L-glutamate gamma-semialdehyde dehydrogenase [Enemella evansiae]OYO12297.1 aldehyde dehydrogenase [Enemella evansiae]
MSTDAPYADLIDDAVALAQQWSAATVAGQTRAEKRTSGQLASLLKDRRGLDLAVRFVDRVARPDDLRVAANELRRIGRGATFLSPVDRGLLRAGAYAAPLAPALVVPLARTRLRQLVGHLVVDATDPGLGKHLARARAEGFRLNINLLGEAVLGEQEAESRARRTAELLARDDIDYVSIKVSSLISQISTWDDEGSVERCVERLRPIYRIALGSSPHSFVNLDMEEYRDLALTTEVFKTLLSEPEFMGLEAGIVLQAYLPDSLPVLEDLIEFARQRVAAGGAGIKVRLVKGANLAMEQVEARLHGWNQAPYPDKAEVDANYLRCVERVLRPELAGTIRVGVASHNLYDVAAAHLLAESRGVTDAMDVEMLQGMAPSQARAVRDTVGTVILYTPVVAPQDFDVAVSYLVRRLEENAAPQNFLHSFFSADGLRPGDNQEQRFRESVAAIGEGTVGPRRYAGAARIGDHFDNTPDSDPALPEVRAWAEEHVEDPEQTEAERERRLATLPGAALREQGLLSSTEQVDAAIATAVGAAAGWAARPAAERAEVLRQAARALEAARGDLVEVMADEAGKTIGESDPEVSEAVDFARWYADRALELEHGPATDGARFVADRVVLVTPPWNFPVAIPIGGVLAGLAAGAAVLIKPAPQTPRCVAVAVEALHRAGVPTELLQFVETDEGEVGKALIAHADVDTVVLTGATETAKLFAGWRSGRPHGARVLAETSGKNSLVVTPSADPDLAVADLVRSAFGHAGQKCSAASLGILVGSVADSPRFRRQLIDAVGSLRVGWPEDLGATMGPVIEAPQGKLRDALTQLQPGERWLVEPKQLDDSGRLWSPGLKEWVEPGSSFHTTEVFGPVLGLMRAKDLDEAIELQNGTDYGLTGGLHSLDPAEIGHWQDEVEVGNLYVNRHITGAIVRRQPFGGWKASTVGPGAKAGGPNYVAQLGHWLPDGLPSFTAPVGAEARAVLDAARELTDADQQWLTAAAGSDAAAYATELGVEQDPSNLVVEANVLRYRPVPVLIRAQSDARPVEVLRLLAGAACVGAEVEVSADPVVADSLSSFGIPVRREPSAELVERLRRTPERVRVVGDPADLAELHPEVATTLLTGPVLATGRRELLTFLREQAISRTRHRYGHVDASLDPLPARA